ncbi:MAG: ABC transporter ATP-binding protein [Chloroflexi bacterium]|nr:ABC transporter ATP-binding protein [Chloroflexota bacterium]
MILKVENLHFSYRDMPTINGVNLTLPEGGMLAVIGPNGAGKSTLLRLVSGILNPKSGNILIKDRPLCEYNQIRLARTITMVPQDSRVDFPYTCREFVMMGRYPYLGLMGWETDGDRRIVEESLASVGADHLSDRRLEELSGGERQRVILARALAQKTPLILLDEPISHLDIGYQVESMELLKKINRDQGIAMIIILHDLNLAARYCPDLLLLYKGEVLAQGKPGQVLVPELMKTAFNVNAKLEKIPGWDSPVLLVESTGRKT